MILIIINNEYAVILEATTEMAGHNVQTNLSRTLNRLTVYPERRSVKAFVNVLTIRSVARDMLLYTVFFALHELRS